MLDAPHLDLDSVDAVSLLVAGYALLCEVVLLQGRGKERAHILWLEHELLVVVCIQADAHAWAVRIITTPSIPLYC